MGNNEVRVKLPFLLDFLSAKGMHLLIFFEARRFSPLELEELDLSAEATQVRKRDLTYDLHVTDYRDPVLESKSFSRLLGKALVPYPERRLSKFTERKKEPYCEFIVGTDSKGQSLRRSCNYSRLSHTDYLTPVFFRREVVQKYYDNPQRYSVGDGYVRCGSLWGLQIDNSNSKFVVVFLGDLLSPAQDSDTHVRSVECFCHSRACVWRARGIPNSAGEVGKDRDSSRDR